MGFWSKFGHILKVAAPIGAMFVPGLQGFGAAALLGRAGIGAATGAMGGGGWKGALGGAATGGVLGGFGHGGGMVSDAGGIAGGMDMGKFALPGAMAAMNDPTGGGGGGSIWSKILRGVSGNAAGAIGGMAKAGAEGREKGREQEMQNYAIRNNVDLNQRRFQEESQSDAYKKAMLGALGMNVQDAHFNRPAGVPDTGMTGGLRPSALGMQGRAAAGVLNSQAMKRLTDGEQFDKLPNYKGNWIDTVLGTAGVLGGGLDDYKARGKADQNTSLWQELLKQQMQQQPEQTGAAPPYAAPAPAAPPPLTPSVTTSEQFNIPWWQQIAGTGIN